jgi:hypothetical protein
MESSRDFDGARLTLYIRYQAVQNPTTLAILRQRQPGILQTSKCNYLQAPALLHNWGSLNLEYPLGFEARALYAGLPTAGLAQSTTAFVLP